MKLSTLFLAGAVAVTALLTIAMMTTAGWDRPPIVAEQIGNDGVAMEDVYNPREELDLIAQNQLPTEPQTWQDLNSWELVLPEEGEPLAGEVYENVQVLGHLGTDQFGRLMQALTAWVSPEEGGYGGCNYCHNQDMGFAWDGVYTKIVARRMLQMTMEINADWWSHVGGQDGEGAGVNCYTCHRGQPVPDYIWFTKTDSSGDGMLGDNAGQNRPAADAGLASLPYDSFTPMLLGDAEIRHIGETPLPTGNYASTKQAEWTYSLMMHMSNSLGVNCTYCHNSRAFGDWEQSPPTRLQSWHGINMVRSLNVNYLEPLGDQYPGYRLGPDVADAPKVNCTTCHQGVNQPLYGLNMVDDYPSLKGMQGAQEQVSQLLERR